MRGNSPRPKPEEAAESLVRGLGWLLIEAGNREHQPLAAELDVLQLPDQLLNGAIGRLGFHTRLAGLVKVVLHRFAVDHGLFPCRVLIRI